MSSENLASGNSGPVTIAASWSEFLAEYPFLSALKNVEPSGSGFTARCPAHEDDRNSLKISMAHGQHLLIHCHAKCNKNDVARALDVRPIDLFHDRYNKRQREELERLHQANGQSKSGGKNGGSYSKKTRGRVVATYDYRDANGKLLFQSVRMDPKDFRQRRPNPDAGSDVSESDTGYWIWNLKDVNPVPYRLPELLSSVAADPGVTVFICEGEKDVDRLISLGLTATTNAGGAGKWREEFTEYLTGRNAVLLQDNDEAGEKHVNHIARTLAGNAASIRILLLPNLPPKGDVSNWLDADPTNNTAERLIDLSAAAPSWAPPPVLPPDDDPDDPHALAKSFRYEFRDGEFATLVYYRGEFLVWKNGAYIDVPAGDLTAMVNLHIREVFVEIAAQENERRAANPSPDASGKSDRVKIKKVTKTLTTNAIEAIRAQCLQPSDLETPFWFPIPTVPSDVGVGKQTEQFPANEILPTKNALIHIRSFVEGNQSSLEYSIDPTPRFFSRNCLQYNFDPSPPPPTAWLKFLASLWPDDPQSIRTLQDWFGYCLMPDTRHQKMLLMVGPRRSGKGTIARTLTSLLGPANVAGPTMSGLIERFGLWSLIGKLLAVIGDARISGRTDTTQVVERLLSISGEDSLTIDRKNLPPLTMRLPTRFMILSNEMPKLGDSSGALASRFIVLNLVRSFYDQEDKDLEEKILRELPGILLWAIEGWQRLQREGRFIQPESSAEVVEEFEALSSPVGAFIKECCVVHPDCRVSKPTLYDEWKKWCHATGNGVSNEARFGRDLRSVLPFLKVFQPRAEQGRVRVWLGIGLLEKTPQNFEDAQSIYSTKSSFIGQGVDRGFGTSGTSNGTGTEQVNDFPEPIGNFEDKFVGTGGTSTPYLHAINDVNKGNMGIGGSGASAHSEVLL